MTLECALEHWCCGDPDKRDLARFDYCSDMVSLKQEMQAVVTLSVHGDRNSGQN
ncbi:hypothetical protein PHMEG_0004284 [Phytophthora megakarya]|uniref:Uncharacterized protein n=1 Tax=Phytophthora megakarya TaxID=4795 RepID=A0A225WUB8_9STRA|nr:hypothetical protein PHMEG_0004284 [Phytophthora megakarya]